MLLSFRQFVQIEQSPGEVIMRFHVTRIDRYGFAKALDGFPMPALSIQHDAQVQMRQGVIGIDFQSELCKR